ncbi:hypothetical protein KF715C_pA1740 (plasmid) [Pseudomonas putida]|uniref:Uncharacterized protein n=1 Tax=Pseudomonas putida TaxID=303 RepID=A0A1L7NMH9_PSEPU|nr:hypothetical protein KF715C_pA1740 [Pseudomonas putida]
MKGGAVNECPLPCNCTHWLAEWVLVFGLRHHVWLLVKGFRFMESSSGQGRCVTAARANKLKIVKAMVVKWAARSQAY